MKYKIMSDLLAPFIVFSLFGTLYVLSRFIFHKRLRIKRKKVNFQAAACAVFLFIIGKVLDTLFKLIACRRVGSHYVHWYFANEECLGSSWFLSFLTLIAIISAFGGLFVYARRLTDGERADPNHFMFQLCYRFKPQYWYWEYVLFIRRVLIALFAVGLSFLMAKLVFLFVMLS